MATDWRRLCRDAGLEVEDGKVVVAFEDQRTQTVYVDESDECGPCLRIWSVAARASVFHDAAEARHYAWERNRHSDLVGLKTDRRGRLIGEAWVPTAGLGPTEWAVYVRTVAATCDRLEYLLTNRDEL